MSNKEKQQLSLYLETSVMGAYFDFKDQESERKSITREFWLEVLPDYQYYISELVKTELLATPDTNHQKQFIELIEPVTLLPITKEVEELAKHYIAAGIIKQTKLADATHLAVATLNKVNFLVTWNYEDLIRPHQRQKIAEFNEKEFGSIYPTIVTPQDYIKDNN